MVQDNKSQSEIGIMHCHDRSTTSMMLVMTWQVQSRRHKRIKAEEFEYRLDDG